MAYNFDQWLDTSLRRLPSGAKLAGLQKRASSFAEQGMQGAANLLVNTILARSLSRDNFAVVGLMLGIHFFLLGVHRSAIVLPFILDASHRDADSKGSLVETGWWWFNLLSLGVIALGIAALAGLLLLIGQSYPEYAWFGHATLLAVTVTPALLFYEFGRRVLYQRHLPATAALASGVYLVLNLGSAWLLGKVSGSPEFCAISWVIAGVGAGAVTALLAPPGRCDLRHGAQGFWKSRDFVFWQTLNNIPYAAYNHSMVILVGLFGGPLSTAAFTATRTLANPAISMVSAVDSLDKPRAARGLAERGMAGLRQSVNRTRLTLIVLCGGYLGLLAIFAQPLLHLAFGATYDSHVNEIRVLAFAFFLICLNQPSETFLVVLRASRVMLVMRCITGAVMVGSIWYARNFGLLGICMAITITQAVNLIGLRLSERIAQRNYSRAQETSKTLPA